MAEEIEYSVVGFIRLLTFRKSPKVFIGFKV